MREQLGAACLAAVALVTSEAIAGQELGELPLVSEGSLVFHVDLAGYRGSEGRTDQEFYVSITNDQVGFSEQDGIWQGELRLEIVVKDGDGKRVLELKSKLRPEALTDLDAEDRGIVQIIREGGELAPGVYELAVKLVDEKTLKPGLFNQMRNVKMRGVASGWIEIHDFGGSQMGLSDLALVRSVRVAGQEAFGRHGVDFDPNASRLYGLVLPAVRCYLEVYAGSAFSEGTSFLVRTRVLDRGEVPVLERKTRMVPKGASFVVVDELPLRPREIAPGRYFLDVGVFNESTREMASVRRSFDIIWSVTSWGQDPEALLQEMALLMRDSEYRELTNLSAGAREVYLAEYWRDLDPDPDTAQNEALIAFRQRVIHADRQFESTLQRGVLTDRGRIYVRYGPPDDIAFEYSSAGFGLDGTSERVAGPGERATLSNRPSASFLGSDEFREGDVSDVSGQTGGANIKAKSLEVWTYDGPGRPLSKIELDADSHRGLKFIFADEMGDGNYQLIGSSGAPLN
jgi:GWxTD domain-containing protein